jgi:hypothetical protein
VAVVGGAAAAQRVKVQRLDPRGSGARDVGAEHVAHVHDLAGCRRSLPERDLEDLPIGFLGAESVESMTAATDAPGPEPG